VVQSSKFELVINAETARMLDLTARLGAASGQSAAAPPSSVMNSRRFIR
jgi:hypothetical protein